MVKMICQILAPLPIGFAVFLVHLATIPITGTGINPARSLGAAIVFNKDLAWDDQVCLLTSILFQTNTDRDHSFINHLLFFVPCSGFSGWARSLGQHLQLCTTKLLSEPFLSNNDELDGLDALFAAVNVLRWKSNPICPVFLCWPNVCDVIFHVENLIKKSFFLHELVEWFAFVWKAPRP